MQARLIIAYVLVAALLFLLVGTIAWVRYHSRERSYIRRIRRETHEHEERLAVKQVRTARPPA